MKIRLAQHAGFCFGVDRAVKIAEDAGKQGTAYTIGPIIHNRQVTERLEQKGVSAVASVSEATPGHTAIICSHGAPKALYDTLRKADIPYEDATCPFVKRIHKIAAEESLKGRTVLIIGDKNHTEVVGISGWADRVLIADSLEALTALTPSLQNLPVSVVAQTTCDRSFWDESVKFIKKVCTNPEIFDTICSATVLRQSSATELSAQSDAMIVIGDRRSANTKRLYEICKRHCPVVIQIETAAELYFRDYANYFNVGITAGASTPKWIIEEVVQKMSEEIKNSEMSNAPQNINAPEAEETFAELLEKSIKTLTTGEKVTGIVTGMSNTEIYIDLGTKHAGYIPVSELSNDPSVKVEDLIKVGQEVETYVMRVNDVEGTAMLSKKRLDTVKGWEEVEQAVDSKADLTGIVVEENKGGIVVLVKGVRVFVPASQTGVPKGTPLTSLIKTTVKLRITEVNRARRRVVGSIRAVSSDHRREQSEKIWTEIEVGKHYKGTVKSLTSYGAFVDIGGVDGMVHVSEMSWSRVRQPGDVVKVGDSVEVHVLSFDAAKKRISLGMREQSRNPWMLFTEQFAIGDVIKTKVVKIMPFGVFAEIIPGVDGLIHISQISDRRIGKPEDVLAEGQEIDCKITNIDHDHKKVWLSIRALLETDSVASEAAMGANQTDEAAAVDPEV